MYRLAISAFFGLTTAQFANAQWRGEVHKDPITDEKTASAVVFEEQGSYSPLSSMLGYSCMRDGTEYIGISNAGYYRANSVVAVTIRIDDHRPISYEFIYPKGSKGSLMLHSVMGGNVSFVANSFKSAKRSIAIRTPEKTVVFTASGSTAKIGAAQSFCQ